MGKHVFIIAEAGVNHNGDLQLAKRLIDEAKSAGVDAVKFQTFKAENIVAKSAGKAEYQKLTTGTEETQFQMLKRLELTYPEFVDLKKYCDEIGILFLSTPFDLESIDFLEKLDLALYKIPSGEITNLPYLEKIGKLGKKIILSTGMSTVDEIADAVHVLHQSGSQDITLLHCNTEYPTPMKDVNLYAMDVLAEKFGCKVGYSDHTLGIEVPIAAVARGAEVIEKHFTVSKELPGPDHRASLEPEELKCMVQAIRNIESALGEKEKSPTESESANKAVARKSIVASCDIGEGEKFSEKNLTVKRPGSGISPMKWYEVMGQKAKKDFKKDEIIEL